MTLYLFSLIHYLLFLCFGQGVCLMSKSWASCTFYTYYSDILSFHHKTSWRVHCRRASHPPHIVLQRPVLTLVLQLPITSPLSFGAAWASTWGRWQASKIQTSQHSQHKFQKVLCFLKCWLRCGCQRWSGSAHFVLPMCSFFRGEGCSSFKLESSSCDSVP